MVPRAIAQEHRANWIPRNPAYVGKIARWTRGGKRKRSKASTPRRCSPTPPRTPNASSPIWRAATTLDGIHLDYVRYPNQQFDYSRFAIAEFRARNPAEAAAAMRAASSTRTEATISSPIPDRFPGSGRRSGARG